MKITKSLLIMPIIFSPLKHANRYIFLTSTYTKIGSVGIIAYVVVTLSVYTNPDSPDSVPSLVWLVANFAGIIC